MEGMEVEESACAIEHRLIHLDLKGAPPKMSYYEQLFPLLSRWGATGLVVEYEDMFPYWGEYKEIACKNAYSVEEIKRLQQLAKDNDLIVIPLVQTFGHLEFVLKLEKFHVLREIQDYPMALCPLQSKSVAVIQGMVEQVMELHPESKWFHIGADEVFHIGLCSQCRKHMALSNLSPSHLFFWHIKRVLEGVHKYQPGMRCIMWDDMYREADLETLKTSGITSLVEPMVWVYNKNSFNLPEDIWDRYSQVFSSVWVASAFKGATGPCKYITDAGFHVDNHKVWLKVIKEEIRPKFKSFSGICMTGWQRYDHYSILCELLPPALPSLAVCLLTITEGSFTKEVHQQASSDLNFSELIPLNPYKNIGAASQCDFPGSGIYIWIQILHGLKTDYKNLLKNERMNGWMSPYNIKCQFANPAHIKHFLPYAEQLLLNFEHLQASLSTELQQVFYNDAVREWIMCNTAPNVDKLTEIVTAGRQLLTVGARKRDDTPLQDVQR